MNIMNIKKEALYTYDAFISYRHGGMDGIIAERLHKALEQYITPLELQKLGLPRKLTRVFRDRDELPVSPNLSDNLIEALEQSRYLIVICSKRTPESLWIQREIEVFKAMDRADRIITILIDGEPDEAFPQVLTHNHRNIEDIKDGEIFADENYEPIAADIRAKTIGNMLKLLAVEKLRILAPILGCSFDDLYQRQKRRIRKRIALLAGAAALFVLLVSSGIWLYSSQLHHYRQEQAVSEVSSVLKSLENRYNDSYTLLVMSEGDIDFSKKLVFETTAINTTKQLLEQRLDVIRKLDEMYPISLKQEDLIRKQLSDIPDSSVRLDNFILMAKENNQALSDTEEAFIQAVTNIKDSESLVLNHTEASYHLVKYLVDTASAYYRGLGLLSDLGEKVVIRDASALELLDLRLPPFETDDAASPSEIETTQGYIDSAMEKILAMEQQAIETNKTIIEIRKAQTEKETQQLNEMMEDLTVIGPDDGPEEVVKKACSLRQLGKFTEAAALYKSYGELYRETDNTAEAYSMVASRFCLTETDYRKNHVAYVYAVKPDGLAEKAGIQAGDIIVSYDQNTEITPESLAKAAAETEGMDNIEIFILRSDDREEFAEIHLQIPGGKLGAGLMQL